RSEALYRLIAENTRDLIALVDLHDKCLYASPSHLPVLGYAPEELLGASRSILLPLGEESVAEKRFAAALTSRDSIRYETRLRHKNGEWLPFESVVGGIFDEQGKAQQDLIISRDISDRKRAEPELRKLAAFPHAHPQ